MLHTVTSDARPSIRHEGWYYAYYDKASATGRACAIIFPEAIKDLVRRGFQFHDYDVHWDDTLRASVLQLDFAEAPDTEGPSLPPDPEPGWGDVDGLPAPTVEPVHSELLVAAGINGSNGHDRGSNGNGNGNGHVSNGNGHGSRPPMRAPAYRKHQAEQQAIAGAQLPAAYLKINLEVSRSFLLQLSLIGNTVGEARRADIAQKLCAIASIPYYRQMGIDLSEEDVKGMTTL